MKNIKGYQVRCFLKDGAIKTYTVVSKEMSDFMQRIYARIQQKTGDEIVMVEAINPCRYMMGNFPNFVDLNEHKQAGSRIELPGPMCIVKDEKGNINIEHSLMVDTPNERITSGDMYNMAIIGIETLVLAMARADIDLDFEPFKEAIEMTLEAMKEEYYPT